MRKILMAVCLLLCASFAASAQKQADGSWLKGTWEGTGYQIDTDQTWAMRLKAEGRRFLIEYPSLNCGGQWRLVRISSRRAVFRERITFGLEDCVDRGTVVIVRLNAKQIAFRYSYQGTNEISASAILNRKSGK